MILYDSPGFIDEEKKHMGINNTRKIFKFLLLAYVSLPYHMSNCSHRLTLCLLQSFIISISYFFICTMYIH